MRDCRKLRMGNLEQSESESPHVSGYLQVSRRCKDGCIVAKVVVIPDGSKKRYVRKLRCPATLGSTSDRGMYLRGAGHPS